METSEMQNAISLGDNRNRRDRNIKIVECVDRHGMTYREVGDKFGLRSVGTVAAIIKRTRPLCTLNKKA